MSSGVFFRVTKFLTNICCLESLSEDFLVLGRIIVRRRTARGGSGGAGESLRGSLKRSAVSGRSLRASVATPQAATGQVCSPNKVCSRQRCTGWVRRLCTRASTVFVFTKCLSGVFSEKIKLSTKNKSQKFCRTSKKLVDKLFWRVDKLFWRVDKLFLSFDELFCTL